METDDCIVEEREWDDLLAGALAPGDVLADKYRVDELLGLGAMGFVLKAWHMQLDEPVAVKFLLPELAANHEALVRFEREARAAFKIKSEHVARVVDVGRLEEGQPFMVMEFLEGDDLGERMYGNQLPIHEAVDYLLQACEAIGEAHALGIVHRDIKPDNLFITTRRDGSPCVKVLDFGLSKVVTSSADAPRERALTGDAQVMGTAHYMSPEQWVAAKDLGLGTDIWALGVILYEAVTGESPFMRNNLAAMCNAVLHEQVPPMLEARPDAPAELIAVVDKCLMKQPDQRYTSVEDLAADLLPLASDYAAQPSLVARAAERSTRGQMGIEDTAPVSSAALLRPAGLPRLGLLNDSGAVDTWTDIMEEAPLEGSSGQSKAALVLVVVASVAILIAALLL